MAYAGDLKSLAERRAGSTPAGATLEVLGLRSSRGAYARWNTPELLGFASFAGTAALTPAALTGSESTMYAWIAIGAATGYQRSSGSFVGRVHAIRCERVWLACIACAPGPNSRL
jgi:hypothetical protein